MKKYVLIFHIIFFVAVACKEDDSIEESGSLEPPTLPQDLFFDINNDGKDDISFEFGQDDVVTDGTPGYVGYVYPLNDGSLLLLSRPDESAFVLDLQQNDTIRKEEIEPFTWYPSNWGFMFIDDSPEGLWQLEWQLSSQKLSNPYYLGIQVKENEDFLLGWLKLEIDKKTGKIEIVDHGLTSEDFIVID